LDERRLKAMEFSWTNWVFYPITTVLMLFGAILVFYRDEARGVYRYLKTRYFAFDDGDDSDEESN